MVKLVPVGLLATYLLNWRTIMSATVYKILTLSGLPAGETERTVYWKNVQNLGKAFLLDIQPVYGGDYASGYQGEAEVRIVSSGRVMRSIETPGSIGVTVEIHEDVYCKYKIVKAGPYSVFNVYLVAFS
jgi:hypothetical protein